MSKKVIEEKLEVLEELIRSAAAHLVSNDDNMEYLRSKDLRDRLYGKFPECFICLKKMGRIGRNTSSYMLPICNRAGITDPKIISLSIKVIQKLMNDSSGTYDINDLKTVLASLERKKDVYSKVVPKPPAQAGRKAVVTRMFNNVKNHLMITRK